MTFEQLFYFVEVYKRQSITEAANGLHISRQCLSKAILKLEDELNLPLFNRSISGVAPTPAAQELYKYATAILNEYTLMKKHMSEFSQTFEQAPTLSIAIPELFLSSCEEALLSSLSAEFPAIDCTIEIVRKKDNPKFYLQYDITVFGVSVPITRRISSNGKYQLHDLMKKPLYIWTGRHSPLVKCPNPSVKDFKEYPFCITRNSSYNGLDFAKYLNISYNVIADTVKGFKDKLRANYFTIDIELEKNKFTYSDILNPEEFQLIKTQEFIYYYILHKSEVNSVYVEYLKKYFTEVFFWDAID